MRILQQDCRNVVEDHDLRSTEQVVLDEFAYYTHFYASGSEEWDAGEDAKIRLETIMGNGRIRDIGFSEEEIR